MPDITREQVEAALSKYQEPYLGTDLVSAKSIKDITVKDGNVTVDVEL